MVYGLVLGAGLLAGGMLVAGATLLAGDVSAWPELIRGRTVDRAAPEAQNRPAAVLASAYASGNPFFVKEKTERPADASAAKRPASFNARVVALNAVLRLEPSMDGWPVGVLEYGTPLRVGRRAGAASPWYRVSVPGGASGWMHGNTFEFGR